MIKNSAWHEEKRERCIAAYSSKTKMKSVKDWRKRIAACKASQADIADSVGISPPRLSEYMRLLVEPTDDKFYAIEEVIRTKEGKRNATN